ncbi:Gfo/Idh/MocA family protein [Paenibacillus ginsengarvi]|uniref:Gfo/Idh/MocA family oxidoreductase n=1 Tax=Paenibacillus ginsengarvi TaxID=400777 RepID=A0A3B0C6Z8_9BACL|nr:Gfo/Idh/MocA family oxidoreductase [Paenibacillus ginsengarvi]RKN79187.1 gfo/Idh/MocA family oxidoreductase [Paenibacillus ginsengarvi]
MKAILVGLGAAGFGWYKRLRDRGLLAAVVESDASRVSMLEGAAYPFYTSLEEALEREKADFLVNVTPPMAHTAINHMAFDRGLPVLCEKPISFDYGESVQIVRRAVRESIPFMIAENYRRFRHIRKVKQLLDSGAIGAISFIDIRFCRFHHVQRNYTVQVLDDIGVHHADLLRYLTGAEAKAVQAKLYNPPGGWAEEGAVLNAHAIIEMEGGVVAGYSASIAARGAQTTWSGDWRIEGTEGAIELAGDEIHLTREGRTEIVADFSGVDAADSLSEFVAALREGREAETSGRDYLNTQALVHFITLSARTGARTSVELPVI